MTTATGFPSVAELNKSLAHVVLLKEHTLTVTDLPQNIKDKLRAFNMQIKSYEKTPSYNRIESLKKMSVVLADLIQTEVIEKDIPDDEPAASANPASTLSATPAGSASSNEPLPKPSEPVPGMKDHVPAPDTKSEFMTKLEKDGRIYHDDLKRMMNKRNLGDNEEHEGVKLVRRVAFYYKQ